VKNTAPNNAADCVKLVEEELSSHDLFYGHGTDDPGAEAQWLVISVLTAAGFEKITGDTKIPEQHLASIKSLLTRRIEEKIPMAYLLNEAWFAGECFFVDERVLVPRSPLAELINNRFEPLLNNTPRTILDLCCGSGCIGLASALAFPDSEVILSDISEQALAVAQINIQRFGLANRVSTCHSDLFESTEQSFDLILANPPYVSRSEFDQLPAEYHAEPVLGLVSEQDGLEIPLKILAQSAAHLTKKGTLILETGYTWPALQQTLPSLPFMWLEFEYGGEGVCCFTAEQLHNHSALLGRKPG
jgi:ribosomal protein L3 glutamine methyltransferase